MITVIVLQHGRWRDTVACLQSLAPCVQQGTARVIVVDNASPDESVAHLHLWIRGGLPASPRPVHDTVAAHWWPLRGAASEWCVLDAQSPERRELAPWTLITVPENGGFAVGMNTGIRAALADSRTDAVWLLNNDTVVAPGTVDAITTALATSPADVGQFGMTVCYYDRPTIVQSVGWCRWNSWLATTHRVHDGASLAQPLSRDAHMPGYVYGASWVLRASALRDVGLLSEDGFLYGEELDWACRAATKWRSSLIADALVWHREGASIGVGARDVGSRSEVADLNGISARLRITQRFFPARLPAVYSSLFGAALNRLRRGDTRRAIAVARLVLAGGLPVPTPSERPTDSPHTSDRES